MPEQARQQDRELPAAPPVPNTVMDLISQRKTLRTRSLNDHVEDIFLRLWQEETFKKYFVAIWREQSVEGSFIDDDVCAARMVRDHAEKNRIPMVMGVPLAAVRRSVRVVAKKYGLSRRERQGMVGDETVAIMGPDNGDEE